jgi:hypothetical protein
MYCIVLYLLLAAFGTACFLGETVTSTMLGQHELIVDASVSLNAYLHLHSRYRLTGAQNRGSPFWIDRGFTEGGTKQPLFRRPFNPTLFNTIVGKSRLTFRSTSSLVHIRSTLAATMVVPGGGVTGRVFDFRSGNIHNLACRR